LGGADSFNIYFQTFFEQFFAIPQVMHDPEFFRSPYGARTARTMGLISTTQVGSEQGEVNGKPVVENDYFYHIMWNVDSLDWQDHNPKTIETRVFNELKTFGRHGIILFHDIHPQTILAIQSILPHLATQGYKVVSLYQLLKEHEQKTLELIKP